MIRIITRFGFSFENFRRFRLPVILAVVAALIITACNPANFRAKADKAPQLVLSMLSDPATFNLVFSQDASTSYMLGFAFEGLTTQDPLTGKIEPALAESWKISDDNLRIVFTLRDGLKWSDGKPLTVDDVIFTYNDVLLNKEIPTDYRDILRIGEAGKLPNVRKLDERRVEFITPEPFAPFLRNTGIPIYPAHVLRESVKTKDTEGKPKFLAMWGTGTALDKIVASGPYMPESYKATQRVVFRRNPYYWRKGPQGEQLPYVERINWEIVENTDTSLLQFRSGGLDYVGITPEYFSLMKREEERGGFKIYEGGPASGTTFFFFNLNQGSRNGKPLVNPVKSRWFNTVEFRQAVAYAMDRKQIVNNIYRGLGELQNSPISVQSPYYLSPEEGLKVYDYNIQKSKKLLKKAGFKYNSQNQLLDSDGNRVRFTLVTNSGNKIREAMGAQIGQDLAKIGIQVDFTPIAWSTMGDKLSNTLDWEAMIMGFTGGVEPNAGVNLWNPEGGIHMFNQKPQAGQKPIEGWKVAPWEAEIGQLYVKGAREFDEAKRKEIYAKSQQISQEYLPLIYLVNPLAMGAARDDISGIKFSALYSQFLRAFWNIDEIKLAR